MMRSEELKWLDHVRKMLKFEKPRMGTGRSLVAPFCSHLLPHPVHYDDTTKARLSYRPQAIHANDTHIIHTHPA